MYVYEEMIDGRKLTDIINREHENIKYLPGHKLPSNVVSSNKMCVFYLMSIFRLHIPDVIQAVNDADILLFILPHQFVEQTCHTIKSHVKKTAFAVSFSKVDLYFSTGKFHRNIS